MYSGDILPVVEADLIVPADHPLLHLPRFQTFTFGLPCLRCGEEL